MSKLKILTYPDTVLRNPTHELDNIDGDVQKMIDQMSETMYAAPGVGLAAIQVGWNRSVLIYDISPSEDGGALQVLINPRIVEQEGEILSENEGCLSVPEFRADVKRYASILVEGLDREGRPLQLEAEGILAIVLQHEIDHLKGKLFIDHISVLKKQMYTRRIKKKLRSQ
ncbi:MAG: peptide deformylase [Deltaproteobacteria bacterium]|jgi:peptide deformylase|nr:peptide deformylase [Deltaproteobacteria bacterium]